MYSRELLDHFQNPRNAGAVEAPDASAQLENPVCGDVLELTLKLERPKEAAQELGTTKLENRRIAEIRFRAKGCVPAIACASALTELIQGKTVQQARQLSRQELVQELLRKIGGLPPASTHASHLAIDTLTALLRGL